MISFIFNCGNNYGVGTLDKINIRDLKLSPNIVLTDPDFGKAAKMMF